jgi:hypothetical protein
MKPLIEEDELDAIRAEALGDAPPEAGPDPLEGLLERVETDKGAVFEPEVLERLRRLKKENRAEWERMRAKLKELKIGVTSLDDAMRGDDDRSGRGPSQSDVLMNLAGDAVLFHSADDTAYADVEINGHRETWAVRSRGFRRWLQNQYFEETSSAPPSEALQAVINSIEARALKCGPELPVHVRVGGHEGAIYIDIGDPHWHAIEVDASGWRVVETPPIRFRRSAGVKPLPLPQPGGSIDQLRTFLNVQSESDFVLIASWALAVLRDKGPYPVLVVTGEQGSSKSTFSEIVRSLLDPNTAPLRSLPREERDLYISATNSHMMVFDNVSSLHYWLSDAFCRLSTGGALVLRQLHTDQDEILFEACRPIILNGIEDIVSRPDLADRAIFLSLAAIPEDRRRPAAELWEDFYAQRPQLLGVLLDALSEGLRNVATTELPELPRMADFAIWASACETALWPEGTFWAAYNENREQTVDTVIDADPVASTVRSLMLTRRIWTGTATDLLSALSEKAGEKVSRSKGWPDTPRALSGRLKRAMTFLRKTGITIEFHREGAARTRTISITRSDFETADREEFASFASASSATSDRTDAKDAKVRPEQVAKNKGIDEWRAEL